MEGWVDLGDLLRVYRDGLPARRRSPIQVLTGPRVDYITTLIEVNALTTTLRRHNKVHYVQLSTVAK